jgi:hypothetical protein
MRVNKYAMPVLSIAVLIAVVLAAQALGIWQVTGSTTVIAVDGSGRGNPDEIKGKMTLDEIIQGYGIPQADLYAALGLPPDTPPSTQVKSLESIIPDFEVDLVRQAVKDYYAAHPVP